MNPSPPSAASPIQKEAELSGRVLKKAWRLSLGIKKEEDMISDTEIHLSGVRPKRLEVRENAKKAMDY